MKETILIIDDDKFVRTLMKTYLEMLKYNIVTASDGFEGINIYKSKTPGIDLVLLDYCMPGLSGIEVYSQLKNEDRNLKTIVVSSSINERLKRLLLREGINDCIRKPVRLTELLSKIKAVLEN